MSSFSKDHEEAKTQYTRRLYKSSQDNSNKMQNKSKQRRKAKRLHNIENSKMQNISGKNQA